MAKNIIIGSRGSDLALWQANYVLSEIKKIGLSAEIKIIQTQGDKVQELSFDKLEGKGFFTKEIEDALLAKEIDIAVHSHKDLPTESPKGLIIAAVSDREDPSEIILINKNAADGKQKFSIKQGAVLGTSSNRRKAQVRAFRDDLSIKDLRGNVPTRIKKLREGQYDAIMLAAAGVERLQIDLSEFVVQKIDPREFVPAPAQGVLAIQIREGDVKLFEELQKINNREVQETIAVERKLLNLFEGGCHLPLGVYCEKSQDEEENDVFKVWASKADDASKFPKLIFSESKTTEGLAEKIFKKINSIQPCSVFITKDLRKNNFLSKALTQNGYKVFGQALIEIKLKSIKEVPKTDWVFFSSKNAVKYFFDQQPQVGDVKYGVVGKTTADALRKYGKRADFIGYSTDTKLTGKQFSAKVGAATVLFPSAKGSMRSIQQQFTNPAQAKDLIVYETLNKDIIDLPKVDLLVFTSPSNVESFFRKHVVSTGQKFVAMGDATGKALKNKGVKHFKMPITFDDLGLAQAIFGS